MLNLLKLISPAGYAGLAVGLALSVLLGIQTVKMHQWRAASNHYEKLYDDEVAALTTTVTNYRTAAAQAKADDAANKARVEAEQAAISKQKDASYEARIADARARADRLRAQLEAATHPRGPAVAPVPGVPAPAGGPSKASGEDGLSDALIATEQAIQLDELIKWVKEQHAVNVNGKE